MAKSRAARRPRRLRARPLLIATGAVLLVATGGCGTDDTPFCQTNGICAQDLATQVPYDLGIAPIHDLKPRGD